MTGWHVAVKTKLGALELDVDLKGEQTPVALVGPNGSGKTTLLRIIAGAIEPASGEIAVAGHTLFSRASNVDLPCEQRSVGYVPQGFGLFPHLRVVDNVAFGLSTGPHTQSRTSRRRSAMAILTELQCAELTQRFPRHLSGGERQRVALARALVIDPAMLLLDEPLSALDAGARRQVRSFLAQRLLKLARPSIVVTHDVRDVAALDAYVCVLDQGRIVQQGTLDAIRAAPVNAFVSEFVGD